MDKERIKKLAEDPKFTPGIYNYCDRWCERCPHTSRCMNFALSEEQFSDPQAHDINNKAFWQKLHEVFQTTLEMLKETAQEMGIDIESIDNQDDSDYEKDIDNITENHHCCQASKAYSQMVKNWFDSADDLFAQKANELGLQAQLELPACQPQTEALELKDAVDIIRWYQHFIYIKLKRAISGTLRDTIEEDFNDSNGSAKVALIAIDRSIAAWSQLRNTVPDTDDRILDILVHLDRLRRITENTFPSARAFIRPGLD
jgi:hypothetical protein